MEGLKINATKFYNHLQHIYNIYGDPKENSSFSKIDALLFVRGKFLEGDKNCLQEKTSQLHEYPSPHQRYHRLLSGCRAVAEDDPQRSPAVLPAVGIYRRRWRFHRWHTRHHCPSSGHHHSMGVGARPRHL